MTHRILEFTAAILLTLAAILSSVPAAHASDIVVSGAFARASASPLITSGAIYLTIANPGPDGDRLLGASTPAAADASFHESLMADGVMKMEMRDSIEVPAGGTVEFKPGGLHIMLMGLTAPLKEGARIDLTLRFEKAGQLTVLVPVASIAATQAPGASGG
jgi:copper(I)-binding protein